MMISAATIIQSALDDHGLTDDRMWLSAKRWSKDFMRLLGSFPEYNQMAAKEFIESGNIKRPDDLISIRRIFVCASDSSAKQAFYGGKMAPEIFAPDGCCDFYRPNQRKGPLLGESDRHNSLFFMSSDASEYEFAIIEYNGMLTDDEGYVMIPGHAKVAAQQYIEYMLTKRERKIDRTGKASQQEVQDERNAWLQEMGIARGRLKTPPMAQLIETAESRWGIRLQGPVTRIR